MIRVKVELISAVTGKTTQLGEMLIANDGTIKGGKRGNYLVKVMRKGCFSATVREARDNWREGAVTREGAVYDYPRKAYNVWRLISKALLSAFPEERPKKDPRGGRARS